MPTHRRLGRVRSTYSFINAQRAEYGVQTISWAPGVAPSDYYEWLQQPLVNAG